MSNEDAFKSIGEDLAAGRKEGLTQKIMALSDTCSDPMDILKCMSLLKLLPQDGSESKLANRLIDMADGSNGLAIAQALYNLRCPYFALQVLKKAEPDDRSYRVECHCQYDLEEYESAMETYGMIKEPCINDRILLSSIQTSVGEHSKSVETATQLLSEYPKDYDVRICFVTALMMAGRDKEAVKYIREGLKDKSADSNAVAAYVLRVQGNIKAAGGYASRAVKLDQNHIGAMETLGICLALKEEYDKARIVAGAINEISPGDKAAINILSYCEGH